LIHGNFFIIIIIISHNDQCNFVFFKSKMKRDLFSNSFTHFLSPTIRERTAFSSHFWKT
jgi:hypothetical protein